MANPDKSVDPRRSDPKTGNPESGVVGWIREMSSRQVFRVLAIYVAVAWGFTEIVAGVVEQVGAPPGIATFTTIAFIVGFPIVMFLAWVFDVDKNGVHRVPTRRKGQLLLSLSLAVLLAASFAIFRFIPRQDEPVSIASEDIVMAVLPFRNLSADTSLDFMGQAIAEDLLNGVAVIPELRVKASFSSFALAGEKPAVFAQELGVNRLLDGTFQQSEGNIRLSARMIDTDSEDVIWTRVLTDSVSNIFQIQDQIAKDIASELGLLHPKAASTTSRKVDPRVYQLYLQARAGMVDPWMDTESTLSKIRQILEIEPNFPEALSMMGFLNTGRAWIMEDRESPWLKVGEEYTLRALEINPDLAEAYAVMALNYSLQYRWKESRQMADRAIEVAGTRPLNIIYTFALNNLGHKDKSIEIIERVFDEDPLNPVAIQTLLNAYADQGEDEKALQWEQLAIERGIRYQRDYLILVYAREGDTETALELTRLWATNHGMPEEEAPNILKAMLEGRNESYEQATDAAVASGELPMGQAIWNYVVSGADEDKVFKLAREAMQSGKLNQIALFYPPSARYRQDPRFMELMGELGLVDYWLTVELPSFCSTENVKGLCMQGQPL